MSGLPLPRETLTDGVVTLRPFTLADVPVVVEACQDREISRWTSAIPWPYGEDDAREWIELHDLFWASGTIAPFAFVSTPDDGFLGSIGLQDIDWEIGSATVGYWAASWARNGGATTRAVVLVCHWAFDILKLGSIQLMTLAGNRPSERVAEKAGFVRVGTVPDYSPERALPTFTPREATHWQLRG